MNHTLEQEINSLHAEFCAALADPKRLLILYTLYEKACTVNELASTIGLNQSTASRHLKVLRERGMVATTRYGATIEYRLADERLIQALDLLRAALRDHLAHRAEMIEAMDED